MHRTDVGGFLCLCKHDGMLSWWSSWKLLEGCTAHCGHAPYLLLSESLIMGAYFIFNANCGLIETQEWSQNDRIPWNIREQKWTGFDVLLHSVIAWGEGEYLAKKRQTPRVSDAPCRDMREKWRAAAGRMSSTLQYVSAEICQVTRVRSELYSVPGGAPEEKDFWFAVMSNWGMR